MLNRTMRVCHRLRFRCAFCLRRRARSYCQINGQRRSRVFLSHIRTPFGRTFIAHPAYREKQRKSLFLGEQSLQLDARPGLGVDTKERILCRGSSGHAFEVPQNRATVTVVWASHIVEEGKAAMKMQGKFGLATAVLLVIPTFSQAQRAGGNFRPATSAPASAPAVHNTAVRARSGSRPGNGHAVTLAFASRSATSSLGIDPLSTQQILDPLSAFGFDFGHAIATRDAQLKAFIDPATQQRLALAERRARRKPKNTNGFIFLDGGGAYVLPPEPGTDLNPDADAQTAQDQGQDPEKGTRQERAQQASQQDLLELEEKNARLAQEQSESLPDEGEFTLILRSGQEIEAVAFTRVDDRIVYITTGGGRRTVAVRELDVDATVRLNQERGTPLQLPL